MRLSHNNHNVTRFITFSEPMDFEVALTPRWQRCQQWLPPSDNSMIIFHRRCLITHRWTPNPFLLARIILQVVKHLAISTFEGYAHTYAVVVRTGEVTVVVNLPAGP